MQADGCRARVHQVATLSNFTSYANGIHGVELSIVGHVRLVGFKVADNVKNGIEIIETQGHWGGPKIQVRITKFPLDGYCSIKICNFIYRIR